MLKNLSYAPLVLEDLARSRDLEPRFLKECYSESGALSQHSLMSKSILEAQYSALFDSTSRGPGSIPAIDKEGISPDLLAESLSRRPILLIGDVGMGKTTFIRHLIKIEAAEVFENAISLYFDLGSQATLAPDLKVFIPGEIRRQLIEDHEIDIDERNFVRGVYNTEVLRFSKGINADLRESDPQLYKEGNRIP